jgi:hypothetical protein
MPRKSFDIEKLSQQEVDALSAKLGDQVRAMCDKTVARANKILSKYGVECKLAFSIGPKGSFKEKEQPKSQS